jgi:chloramphenicol O-acetyltransferase
MKDYLKKHPELEYICWQGEVCAPGIQKNPQGLTETHLFCFHMIDSKIGKYDIRDAVKIWKEYEMETVPIIDENYILPDDFEDFKKTAEGYYDASVCEGKTKQKREGFVYYKTTDPNFSFKNVSREYLLKHS